MIVLELNILSSNPFRVSLILPVRYFSIIRLPIGTPNVAPNPAFSTYTAMAICGMVFSMRVLSGARLAADLDAGKVGCAASAAQHCHSHTFRHYFIVFLLDTWSVLFTILAIYHRVCDRFYDMRGIEMSSVRDGGAKVGYLKWGCKHLALADCNRDD